MTRRRGQCRDWKKLPHFTIRCHFLIGTPVCVHIYRSILWIAHKVHSQFDAVKWSFYRKTIRNVSNSSSRLTGPSTYYGLESWRVSPCYWKTVWGSCESAWHQIVAFCSMIWSAEVHSTRVKPHRFWQIVYDHIPLNFLDYSTRTVVHLKSTIESSKVLNPLPSPRSPFIIFTPRPRPHLEVWLCYYP